MTNPLNVHSPPPGDDWRKNIEEKIDDLEANDKETFQRLGKLERFQSFVLGAASVVGAAAGYVIAWLRGDKP